jgi:protein SCO1/2
MRRSLAAAILLGFLATPAARADSPNAAALPKALEGVGFDQRLGELLPLDLELRDEDGRGVELGAFFGERPVVLALVYYECPMLCTLVLNGLTGALKGVGLEAGKDFEVVVVSFDPRETPELARAKKAAYLDRYGRPETAPAWHFLTGSPAAIERLTAAAGFRYAWDEAAEQFAHPSGILTATPEGRISRYLFGTDFAPRDLRLALVESAGGRIGTRTDQVLLYCYHYDPATGRYSAAVMNLVRAGALATVASLALVIGVFWRSERAACRNHSGREHRDS